MHIYIDVTETVATGLRTGIQRVVREVARHAVTLNTPEVTYMPVVAVGNVFYRHMLQDLPDGIAGQPSFVTKVRDLLRPVYPAFILAKAVYRTLLHIQSIYVHSLRDRKRSRVIPKQGDVLLLIDSCWSFSSTLYAARAFRKQGGSVVLVVHDLIPLTHPQYCTRQNVSNFALLVPGVVAVADGILAISRHVLTTVQDAVTVGVLPIKMGCQIDYFYHGADFKTSQILPQDVQDVWPQGLWGDHPVFLMVGTIEPRKGHAFVYRVFVERWERGLQDRLLIIGKRGWYVDALVAEMKASVWHGTHLFIVYEASDAVLASAYQRCHAMIAASYVEGFGLPLVEAMQHGAPVLASDIPVFREIAGDRAHYFTVDDAASLDHALDDMCTNGASYKAGLEDFRWLTWQEATQALMAKVVAMTHSAPRM